MPTFAVDARPDGALDADLDALAAAVMPGAPVTVMIHGFRYAPGSGKSCPHRTLFAEAPPRGQPRIVGWPRKLGLVRQGLGVGFGWHAAGTIWNAHGQAGRAGGALADLVRALRQAGSGPVHVIAHSLGARVALSALPGLQAGDVGRMVLMSAAEFRRPAAAALATPAGRAAEVLNVTSRENDLFDGLLELLFAAGLRDLGPALGTGLSAPNLTTLQIDGAGHRRALASLGFPLPDPGRRICHWSPYLRPGLFPLYRAVLDGRLPLPLLAASLPARAAPRWSRLILPLPRGPSAAQ